METFAGAREVFQLLASLEQEVADADAAFQIAQQRGWNRMTRDTPLLEGYDRLANLGLAEVKVSLALVPVGQGWFRRVWSWLTRADEAQRYRVLTDRDPPAAVVHFAVTIRRDARGRWTTSPDTSPTV